MGLQLDWEPVSHVQRRSRNRVAVGQVRRSDGELNRAEHGADDEDLALRPAHEGEECPDEEEGRLDGEVQLGEQVLDWTAGGGRLDQCQASGVLG
jgi:hypothetical protein